MSTRGSVLTMFAPDGSTGDIPTERVGEAQKAGFKVAVPMTSPDGKQGFVPFDRQGEAQKAGFKTAYNQPSAGPSAYGFGAGNLASQAWQGVKNVGAGAYQAGKDVLFPEGQSEGQKISFLANKYLFDPADKERALAQRGDQSGIESVGHSIAAALPFIGPWAAGIGEQAGTGDVGGALARGAAEYGTIKAGEGVVGKVPAVRGALRDAAYQELPTKGPQLVKGASRVGRAAGTLVGGGVGSMAGPGGGTAGGVAGFELGPSILERVLGKPELGDIRNPGPFAKVPARVKPPAGPPPPEVPLGSPENPGWHAKLPTRMPKALPAPTTRLPFLPEGTPSNAPIGNATLPELPAGEATPFPNVVSRTWPAPKPPAAPPQFLPGATPSNVPVGNAQLPFLPKGDPLMGMPTPFPTVQPKAAVTGGAQNPFEPQIFASPEEAAAHDFRMKNLQRQAKAAGTYHAAQGASRKKTNLQQRIQSKIDNEE